MTIDPKHASRAYQAAAELEVNPRLRRIAAMLALIRVQEICEEEPEEQNDKSTKE